MSPFCSQAGTYPVERLLNCCQDQCFLSGVNWDTPSLEAVIPRVVPTAVFPGNERPEDVVKDFARAMADVVHQAPILSGMHLLLDRPGPWWSIIIMLEYHGAAARSRTPSENIPRA